MKKVYVSIVMITFALGLVAQPTLTMANSAPMPGESFLTHYAAWQSEGSSGANQTWDFSNLVSDSSKTIGFVDPTGTPNGSSFPDADVAQEEPGAGIVYFDYANGDLEYIGAEANGLLVEMTDPEVFQAFPCTFGTTWADTQAGTIPFGGTRAGNTTGDGDAYGTLILPWGTVNNVLRVHLARDFTDNIIAITIDYDLDFYMFYKEGTSMPFLIVSDLLITPSFGAPTNTKYIQYADQSAVGIGEEIEVFGDMRVYPMPATNMANVELELLEGSPVNMELIDIAGRVVLSEDLGTLAPGKHLHQLDLSGLNAGSYFIQLHSQNNTRVEKLIVQ